MAESTLGLTFETLEIEIADYRGHGRTAANWTTADRARVDAFLQEGIRRVCRPPILPGMGKAHEWSWLRVIYDFDTVADQWIYDLPDDFASLDGVLTIHNDNEVHSPIRIVNETFIRRQQSLAVGLTGAPSIGAEVHKRLLGGAVGQRSELWFYPTPDAVYSIKMGYKVLPDALTAGSALYYGGAAYASLFRASCLAVAAEETDDSPMRTEIFMRELAAAVSHDQSSGPDCYGAYGDRRRDLRLDPQEYQFHGGGVEYENA